MVSTLAWDGKNMPDIFGPAKTKKWHKLRIDVISETEWTNRHFLNRVEPI